ncbi:MAG TPA: hypothetical protein PKU71_12625 [bacterium]|nr:hypothetical protein [bacterium]HND77977.1 hypothetical protein [bacterium]HNH30258.1 hypothetical protein [bacterium]HNO91991.1 hypothetical protein [bacterium]
MDRLSIWWIRGALIYFVVGVTLGALLLLHKTWSWDMLWWRLLPLHIYTMLLGFMIPFIIGVAHWILPRNDGPHDRGNPKLVITAWILWHTGLIAGLTSEITGSALSAITLSVALCNIAAVMIMFTQLWRRLRLFKQIYNGK